MMRNALLLSIALLMSVYVSAQDIQSYVGRQLELYPKSRLLDIYKSCFQDFMGAEHLVTDRQSVKVYLEHELELTSLDELLPWYFEPCGTDSCFFRVSLRVVKEGLVPEDLLLDAFIRSANSDSGHSVESWIIRWRQIEAAIDEMNIGLSNYQNDKNFIDSVLAEGRYAISHSPDYREAYRPHYRIVERSIFENQIRPLLVCDESEGEY